MLQTLSRYWWLVVLRGVVAILFGILAFALPEITVGVLVILFGAYSLVDGVSALIAGFSDRDDNDRWWVLLLEGIVGIGAGIVAFVWPGITAIILLYVIAAWAIVTGVLEIVAAVSLRKEIEGEWILALTGVASIVFGAILFFSPGPGLLALIWVIGAYAILFGGLLLYLGFKLKNGEQELLLRGT